MAGHALALLFLIVFPFMASDFVTFQIGAYALVMGTIALSLMLLAGYGGMVSLAQMTAAGLAGYMMAILGHNSTSSGLEWPWWAAAIGAILVAVLFSTMTGLLAVRTAGIYTIMITLAISVAVYYFAQQNYAIFNGHSGFAGIEPPILLGIDWRTPKPFYYLSLIIAGLSYAAVLYLSRAPFGLALQAIRDNPRRMEAIGFHVDGHRVAAYALSGLFAGMAGVLLVWFDGRISPGSISVDRATKILVIAVVGGVRHPAGPFLGALLFVLLQNFAIDLISPERFNLVIGLAFLAVVLLSPDGILGLLSRLSPRRSDGGV
jgi:branched-chain amino acid transport system permease protein